MYTLVIWTIVAATPMTHHYDWRSVATFHNVRGPSSKNAFELCQDAAKKLNVKKFECIGGSV